jgi:hypothetical protein
MVIHPFLFCQNDSDIISPGPLSEAFNYQLLTLLYDCVLSDISSGGSDREQQMAGVVHFPILKCLPPHPHFCTNSCVASGSEVGNKKNGKGLTFPKQIYGGAFISLSCSI